MARLICGVLVLCGLAFVFGVSTGQRGGMARGLGVIEREVQRTIPGAKVREILVEDGYLIITVRSKNGEEVIGQNINGRWVRFGK